MVNGTEQDCTLTSAEKGGVYIIFKSTSGQHYKDLTKSLYKSTVLYDGRVQVVPRSNGGGAKTLNS